MYAILPAKIIKTLQKHMKNINTKIISFFLYYFIINIAPFFISFATSDKSNY
jgi:hypothetical protein